MIGGLSIRSRLTLWWGGLFFLFGLLLLGVSHLIVTTAIEGLADEVRGNVARELGVDEQELPAEVELRLEPLLNESPTDRILFEPLTDTLRWIRNATLTALVVLAAAAAAAGWFVAGRMLTPVRAITETARRISDADLSHRIAAVGPQDELRELADAFDAMLERLERGFDAQRAFTADASHELRTPLTLIRAELDVTLDDPDATRQELVEAAGSIRVTLEHTELLIDRLLQLASAEAIHDRHPVPVHDLVRASTDVHLPPEDELDLQLELRPAVAFGDVTLLSRLVDNLVHNAVRHNHPGGWIQAATRSEGELVQVVVTNSGPALADHELVRLTDRFYRPDPSRARQTGGSGLGLAIVAAIVRAHGGTLELGAVIGGGLEVKVRLPAASGV